MRARHRKTPGLIGPACLPLERSGGQTRSVTDPARCGAPEIAADVGSRRDAVRRPHDAVATWAIAAVPAVAVGLAQVWMPSGSDATAICPFRRITGGWCPFCGLTRASVQLLRGNAADAFSYHPLVVPALVSAVVVWLIVLGRRVDLSRWSPPWLTRRHLTVLATAEAIVFVGVWLARLNAHDIPRPFT